MFARAPIEPGGIAVTGSHGLATAGRILHVATADGTESSVARGLHHVLRVCGEMGLTSVALPLLRTGTGGLAATRFAELLCDAIADHAADSPVLLRLVAWSSEDYAAVASVLKSDTRVDSP